MGHENDDKKNWKLQEVQCIVGIPGLERLEGQFSLQLVALERFLFLFLHTCNSLPPQKKILHTCSIPEISVEQPCEFAYACM